MVVKKSLANDLSARGFEKLKPRTRGVDINHFYHQKQTEIDLPCPIFFCVERIAVEKNHRPFLTSTCSVPRR